MFVISLILIISSTGNVARRGSTCQTRGLSTAATTDRPAAEWRAGCNEYAAATCSCSRDAAAAAGNQRTRCQEWYGIFLKVSLRASITEVPLMPSFPVPSRKVNRMEKAGSPYESRRGCQFIFQLFLLFFMSIFRSKNHLEQSMKTLVPSLKPSWYHFVNPS